jgi:phosphoglycerate dehydrogenase-like enzyme
MSSHTVLYLGPESGLAAVKETLGSGYEVLAPATTPTTVLPLLPQAHAILDASMKVPLRQAELGTAALLKIIVTATTGADHIDSATLKERNIPLLTLKGQKQVLNELTPAAELSWMLLMACARHLRAANKHVEAGLWDREQFPGMLLKGRTLGLIGCGRIGQWMARYATAFGMHVVGHDPHLPEKEWPATIERADLDTVLRSAHAVSIHVHLSDETRGLVRQREFGLMRPGTILINTSRGAICDEDALLQALESGHLGAYGTDVLEGEPDIQKSRVWRYAQKYDNCLITPHIGGFSPDAVNIVLKFSAERIRAHFASQA